MSRITRIAMAALVAVAILAIASPALATAEAPAEPTPETTVAPEPTFVGDPPVVVAPPIEVEETELPWTARFIYPTIAITAVLLVGGLALRYNRSIRSRYEVTG